jgi:hypothetical protein
MNKEDLLHRLISEKIPIDSYSLDGGIPNDRLVLSKNRKNWEVYYSERGVKYDIKTFLLEKDACEYFYIKLVGILSSL